jgi:phage repressor protein C with HTH and peptisase S24 domain
MPNPTEILINARKDKGLTQTELASQIGLGLRMYQKFEEGLFPKFKRNHIEAIDKILGTDLYELIYELNTTDDSSSKDADSPRPELRNPIPYFPDMYASAGLSFLTENKGLHHEMIYIPNVDATAFINVFGDSMYPKYCAGEIIGIKEIEKDFVMFGNAYVIQMKNGEAYIKYIRPGVDELHWKLANENKNYEPKEFHISMIDKVFIIKAVITRTTL